MMTDVEKLQLLVIASMLFVNFLKTIGFYYVYKYTGATERFNPAYIVSAVLGVFVGYWGYVHSADYTTIDVFMASGKDALLANLMFDVFGKIRSAVEVQSKAAPPGA